MESLIIFAVIAIISSLFGKKEKSKNTKSMPPFNQSQSQQEQRQPKPKQARSLEDFANEIFGQLEQKKAEVQQQWEAPKPVQVERAVVEKVELPKEAQKPITTRPNIEKSTRIVQMKEREAAVFTPPTTKKALVQAIVAAEILGPPKAKQRQVR